MSLVHLHLLLNHLPVVGIVLLIALFAIAMVRRSSELTKVSLAMLVALAVVTGMVFLTGEPAEELVENLAGVSEAIIERHEEAALVATIAMAAAGVLSLVALVGLRHRLATRRIASLGLVATVGVGAVMSYAANLGGQIRHSEIRADATASLSDEAARLDDSNER